MNDANQKVQAPTLQVSASEEMIAKTLKDHRDHYNQWAKRSARSSYEDDVSEKGEAARVC